MLFKTAKDWKSLLSPEDESRLNALLENVRKHRGAYFNADEVKLAQVWCAMLELKKENASLGARVRRMEYLLGGVLSRSKKLDHFHEHLVESCRGF